MSGETPDFKPPMRKLTEEQVRDIMVEAAIQVYTEAGRPYGESVADLKRWWMEGGYEEHAAEKRRGPPSN